MYNKEKNKWRERELNKKVSDMDYYYYWRPKIGKFNTHPKVWLQDKIKSKEISDIDQLKLINLTKPIEFFFEFSSFTHKHNKHADTQEKKTRKKTIKIYMRNDEQK